MTTHPIYAAINKPLLLLGVDRRVCGTAVVGVLLPRIIAAFCNRWGLFQSLLGVKGLLVGAILGGGIWLAGRMSAAHDPQFVSLILAGAKLRRQYDPGRR